MCLPDLEFPDPLHQRWWLIFVPSKDGKSHSPEEWTDIDDIVPGVELLLETVLRLDGELDRG